MDGFIGKMVKTLNESMRVLDEMSPLGRLFDGDLRVPSVSGPDGAVRLLDIGDARFDEILFVRETELSDMIPEMGGIAELAATNPLAELVARAWVGSFLAAVEDAGIKESELGILGLPKELREEEVPTPELARKVGELRSFLSKTDWAEEILFNMEGSASYGLVLRPESDSADPGKGWTAVEHVGETRTNRSLDGDMFVADSLDGIPVAIEARFEIESPRP